MADNKNIKVYDNYIDPIYFAKLQKEMMSERFTWTYTDQIISKEPRENNFQFVHLFFNMSFFVSDKIDLIRPIIDQLGAVAIHRIKANCNLRTEQIKEAGFHTDISESRMIESEPMVAILYINSNDGYTIFEDGTKINSLANRVCIFPYWMRHSGTNCTNTNRRIVININYVR